MGAIVVSQMRMGASQMCMCASQNGYGRELNVPAGQQADAIFFHLVFGSGFGCRY